MSRTNAERNADWARAYGIPEQVMEYVAPAYARAVAPVIASAVSRLKKRRVKLLVVQSGTGGFSRHVLPEVRRILSARSSDKELSVVESDISPVVTGAGGPRVVADSHCLPFDAGSFDLVFGNSALPLHWWLKSGMHSQLGEIKRVLGPEGVFIHVQSHAPLPRGKALTGGMGALTFRDSGREIGLAKQLHGAGVSGVIHPGTHYYDFSLAVSDAALSRGLDFQLMELASNALVDRGIPLPDIPGLKLNPDKNTFSYCVGTPRSCNEDDVPADKRRVRFQGIIGVAARTQVGPFMRRLKHYLEV